MVYLFSTTYISVDLAYYDIFHAKVGDIDGGINGSKTHLTRGETHNHQVQNIYPRLSFPELKRCQLKQDHRKRILHKT